MKYIKTYEDKNYEDKLNSFSEFLINFLNTTLKSYSSTILFSNSNHNNRISFFIYRFAREDIFYLKKNDFIGFNHFFFEKNDFAFSLYNELKSVIDFIEHEINKYKDTRGLVHIKEIPNIEKEITRENFEIFKNVNKYNI